MPKHRLKEKTSDRILRLRTELARLRVAEAPLVQRAFLIREIERLEKLEVLH